MLIHIGYHKTGTTFLQRNLFQRANGYVPHDTDIDVTHRAVFEHITKPHRLAFDAEAARAALIRAPEPGTVPVISSEILSGHPFWGARASADFAERLHAIAPQAKILITIRAQIPAIASVYMQYVRRAGRLAPQAFFAENPVVGYDAFDPVHFEYDRLLGCYQDLFGPDHVKIMTQEHLARDPKSYIAELAQFSGADPDATPSFKREGASEKEAIIWALRRINYFRCDGAGPDPILNLGPVSNLTYRATAWTYRQPFAVLIGAKRKPVTAFVKERFGGRFAAANRRLQERAGPALDLTGYEL